MDKGFNMQDYNEKTEPLRIENQGPIRRTAILGRDTRRATLFCGLEFWFFHDLQVRLPNQSFKKSVLTALAFAVV